MFLGVDTAFGFLFSLAISGGLAWWAYKLAAERAQNPWVWAIATFIFPIAIIAFFFIGRDGNSKEVRGSNGQASLVDAPWPDWETIDFCHEFKDTGIAIDRQNRKIFLKSVFDKKILEKQYLFSDVRSWNTNIATGGQTVTYGKVGVSAAIGVGVNNYMVAKRNEEQTGLFVNVKDIDFPEWRIAFSPTKEREMALKRWMEIMRQVVNEE